MHCRPSHLRHKHAATRALILLAVIAFLLLPPLLNWQRAVAAPAATIEVVYNPDSSCNIYPDLVPWSAEAQAAFTYAADQWGALLTTSQTIVIHACWRNMAGSSTLGSASTADLEDGFANQPILDTNYPIALANALAGSDLNGDDPEIFASFNSSVDWYFGTAGNTPKDKLNFVHVVLHELAHGLGFNSALQIEGGMGKRLNLSPSIYERFTEDQAGVSILDPVQYPDNSPQLAAALQSNALFFDGPHANAANGNRRVPIYAPNPYEPSSSHGHLSFHFEHTTEGLMLPVIDNNARVPHPGWVTLGILKDMGWAINDDGGPSPFLLTRPEHVVFTTTVAGIDPAPLLIEIFAHRPDAAWTATLSSGNSWLNASTLSGSGNAPLTLTADVEGLPPGYYSAILTIALTANPEIKATIPVALVVAESEISDQNLIQNGSFESLSGWTLGPNAFIGQTTINGKNIARSGAGIAGLGQNNGESAELSRTVTIPNTARAKLVYFSTLLSFDLCGYDHAEVRINDTVVEQQTLCARTGHDQWRTHVIDLSAYLNQTVTIAFRVQNDSSQLSTLYLDDVAILIADLPAAFNITPKSLTFNAVQGSGNPPAQAITIQNSGGGTLQWVAAETIPWLNLSASSGTAPTTISASIDTSGLVAGQPYSGQIIISQAGELATLQAGSQIITVTLNYTSAPAVPILSVAPSTLAFTATVGSKATSSHSFTVQNSGSGTLAWQASEAIPWLTLSQEAGTAPTTVTVLVNPDGLAEGTHSGTVTISDSNVPATTREIAVQFVIQPAPSEPVDPTDPDPTDPEPSDPEPNEPGQGPESVKIYLPTTKR